MDRTLLIVEDEYRMRHLLSDYFKREGFNVVEAENGVDALEKFKDKIDLIILDIMMPLLDGWSVCQTIRNTSDVPIIILTAKSEEGDKLMGYELGADDYITKPFSPKVLVAKVKALLKRAEGISGKQSILIDVDGLIINDTAHEVIVDGEYLNLSPKEFDLLLYLVRNRGVALSRDKILDNVWGYGYYGDLRTVDTHIKRIREKLKEKGDIITTIRGSGYKLEIKK
jgi:DNA-binding response OmpR family regulator